VTTRLVGMPPEVIRQLVECYLEPLLLSLPCRMRASNAAFSSVAVTGDGRSSQRWRPRIKANQGVQSHTLRAGFTFRLPRVYPIRFN
jgi:hypothetical protein